MRRKKAEAHLPRERRKESRVEEEDKVVLELFSNSDLSPEKKNLSALTKDISPGGVRIMTNVNLPVGTLLRLEIGLARPRKLVRALGSVRWSRSVYGEDLFELGIEFTQISSEDKLTLLEHTYRKR
ncbi:MAG: PilZ domain-containing protein [Candidatus Aminicenantales bacterium]